MRFIKYILIVILVLAVSFGIAYFVFSIFGNPKTKPPSINKASPTATPGINKSIFTLENAPSKSLVGYITKMQGEIKWQDRLATESATILQPQEIHQGEMIETGEKSSLTFEFDNYVTATMSADTEIDIIQTLPENILFSQPKGYAEYFADGEYPITARSKYLLVEFDGEISVETDDEDLVTTIIIKSGNATAAYNDLYYVSHVIPLTKGDVYVFNQKTRRGALR